MEVFRTGVFVDFIAKILYIFVSKMEWEKLTSDLCIPTETKIVLLVMDGLGDLPVQGKTALETANIPHLDNLACQSSCGLTHPVFLGITPGSGPAHLSLFGYDPMKYILGRGILEALGVGVKVSADDMVARGNFATLKDHLITDRRAGRIPTQENARLCREVNKKIKSIKGIQGELFPGKEHRFVLKLSGSGLSDELTDADPQKDHREQVDTKPLSSKAEMSAEIVNSFIQQIKNILKFSPKANTILLRGFSKHPSIPSMKELFRLNPAAIAQYPMYKGLAKLVGMEILEGGQDLESLITVLERHFTSFDFFYIHVKKTDSCGEDGRFKDKVKAIEETDSIIPRILSLNPDVFVVTSDHSTPCFIKGHSWHPNPFCLHAKTALPDRVTKFSERACGQGYLGTFRAIFAMPLMLAHAGKLKKFGA